MTQRLTSDLFLPGTSVFVVTKFRSYLGRVKLFTEDNALVLENASWVADTGRLSEFLKNGPSNKAEIEVYPSPVTFCLGDVWEITEWLHELPTKAA